MADAGIGRILIASLHQGVADVDPTRLEFYEPWLSPTGFREHRIGLAPLNAALSFLRREGSPTYERIMTRAGQCAADWTFENCAAVFERALALMRVEGAVGIRECRAAGGAACRLHVAIRGSRIAGREAEAA